MNFNLRYFGDAIWNSISSDIKNNEFYNEFHFKIKKWKPNCSSLNKKEPEKTVQNLYLLSLVFESTNFLLVLIVSL